MRGLIEVMAFSGALIALLVWATVMIVSQRLKAWPVHPGRRTIAIRALMYAPLWVTALTLLLTLIPGAASTMLALSSHCFDHCFSNAAHHHLCAFHPPEAIHHPLWLIGAGMIVLAIGRLVSVTPGMWRASRLIKTLIHSSEPSTLGQRVRTLRNSTPLAVTAGFFRPVVLLSAELQTHLSPTAMNAVLAHEQAHCKRKDPLWMIADTWMLSLYPKAIRTKLQAQLTLAIEQTCDDYAAAAIGSRLDVAAALVHVARLRMPTHALGASVSAGNLEARISHLLQTTEHVPRRGQTLLFGFAMTTLILISAEPVHSALEHVISALLHVI